MPTERPVAVVTGASAGIGKEIARSLAARGYDLVLSARREAELTELGLELTRAHKMVCHVVPADLADPAGPGKLAAAVAEKGIEPDVLVNNAGFGALVPFHEQDLATALRMVQVNVTALTELTGRFLPGMVRRERGRILNVGSVAGFQPGPMMAVYYATKAYVNSFSEAIARELAATGVTVTVLCPGPTESEFAAVSGMNRTEVFAVGKVMGTRPVAEAGVEAMLRGRPLVVTGLRNKVLLFLERFVPRSWVIGLVGAMQQRRR